MSTCEAVGGRRRACSCVWAHVLAIAVASAAGGACTKHDVVDIVMASSYEPGARPPIGSPDYELLAGDMHVHVRPPDGPGHVSRGLERTIELARESGLDFIVLTPHLWSGFEQEPERRRWARRQWAELRRRSRSVDDVSVVVGFEYTGRWGHVGAAFADLHGVLDRVSADRARDRPEAFLRSYVEQGGVLVINHPYVTPLESVIRNATWDLSWKRWTSMDRLPAAYATADGLAQAVEVYNADIAHLRDRYVLRSPGSTTRSAWFQLERQILRQRRRITPVGGSDSHSDHLRAATFLLARERSVQGIREAIVAGRVCVRDAAPCTLQVRAPGGRWRTVGAAFEGVDVVEARVQGRDIHILYDGQVTAMPRPGTVARLEVDPSRCGLLRARADGGESAPVYVNCPFARR